MSVKIWQRFCVTDGIVVEGRQRSTGERGREESMAVEVVSGLG
jgi:hypothetical protein